MYEKTPAYYKSHVAPGRIKFAKPDVKLITVGKSENTFTVQPSLWTITKDGDYTKDGGDHAKNGSQNFEF